jgi:hypothetical protein
MPMSPPGCRLSPVTYGTAELLTTVDLAQSDGGTFELKTCFCVPLMKLANGSTSDVGQ